MIITGSKAEAKMQLDFKNVESLYRTSPGWQYAFELLKTVPPVLQERDEWKRPWFQAYKVFYFGFDGTFTVQYQFLDPIVVYQGADLESAVKAFNEA